MINGPMAFLYKELHGPCAGLGELKFKGEGVQQRPIGFRSGQNEFTILLWAHEKENKFVPLNACEEGLKRKDVVLKSKDRTNVLWLALE
jgi:hypothetical protein